MEWTRPPRLQFTALLHLLFPAGRDKTGVNLGQWAETFIFCIVFFALRRRQRWEICRRSPRSASISLLRIDRVTGKLLPLAPSRSTSLANRMRASCGFPVLSCQKKCHGGRRRERVRNTHTHPAADLAKNGFRFLKKKENAPGRRCDDAVLFHNRERTG